MQLSIAKDIFGSPWHLSANGFQQYFPVVVGMMNGALIVEESEPEENKPSLLSAATQAPVMYYSDDEDPDLEEESQREKVVHVMPVRGVMMKHDMTCGPRGTRTLGNRLRHADSDSSVIGHVLIIEGPGGAANAVPELADAIRECKKPVVVWVDGIMASAHMYAGSYANEIIASRPTDLVGCIGTMITYSGRTSKSEEDLFKVREVTIYADDAYEKNEEYEKAINDFDFKLVKERVLNPHNQQFVNDIKMNLPGVEDKHLHGRTFNASEVIGALVHAIGPFEDAVNRVIELAQQSNAGSNGSQASTNNQNQKVMSKKYLNIQKAMGSQDPIEVEADGSRTFSPDEMEAVDNALGSNSGEELQGQLDTANASLGTANATIAERDQTIASLNNQIAELRALPAEPAATAHTTSDEHGDTDGPVAKENDGLMEGIEKVSQAYLGKGLTD